MISMMRRWTRSAPRAVLLAAAAILCQAIACSRAETVDPGGKNVAKLDARGNPELPFNPEHPLVVDSPAKLFTPGGTRRVQEALAGRGYLTQPDDEVLGDTTQSALARFQKDSDLAATGFPDGETLRRLGLDPEEIYRAPLKPEQAAVLLREREELQDVSLETIGR